MANGEQTPTIDFSKYQQPAAAPAIDFSKYASGTGPTGVPTTAAEWDALKDKYGLPHSVDLSKTLVDNWGRIPDEDFNKIDVEKFSKAWQEAHPEEAPSTGYFGRGWQTIKNAFSHLIEPGSAGSPAMAPIPAERVQQIMEHPATAVPILGPMGAGVAQTYREQGLPAAAGEASADIAMLGAPFALHKALELTPSKVLETQLGKITGRTLGAAEADTPRPEGAFQPARNVTPREVLTYAHDQGLTLTPGQATEDGAAYDIQKAGRSAAITGKQIEAETAANMAKVNQRATAIAEASDPKRMGLSEESAGLSAKQAVATAKDIAHENASNAYQNLPEVPMDTAQLSKSWTELRGAMPMGVEEKILGNVPRDMKGLVEEILYPSKDGPMPMTADQALKLRSLFLDLGRTVGADLPSRSQAIFKMLSHDADSIVAKAYIDAGQDPGMVRAAQNGWKDYVTKYGDPSSPLYKILDQRDPTKVVSTLKNLPATDLAQLRAETGVKDATGKIVADGPAIEALKRQVINDIQKSRFNISHNGLGDYSDAYLRELFGPETTKELYLQSDLMKRLKFDPNPSGTGSQLNLWHQTKAQVAAKLSLPKDPLSFLSDQGAPAVRTTPFAPPAANNPLATPGSSPAAAVVPTALERLNAKIGRREATYGQPITSPATGTPITSPEKLFNSATKSATLASEFNPVLKDTGWEYLGKNSMGINEFKEPGSNISISVLDKDMNPEKVRLRIQNKLKEFGR